MKTLTINQMILNAISTPLDQEPKYKDVLELLGIKIIDPQGWSGYNCWGIKISAPKFKVLVISKDYKGRRGIFATAHKVCNWNDKKRNKIDWYNFICTRGLRENRGDRYENKTYKAKMSLYFIRYYKNKIKEHEEEIRKLQESLHKISEDLNEEKAKLKEMFPKFDVDKF